MKLDFGPIGDSGKKSESRRKCLLELQVTKIGDSGDSEIDPYARDQGNLEILEMYVSRSLGPVAETESQESPESPNLRFDSKNAGGPEQPSDPRAEGSSMPRGIAVGACPAREHLSKQGSQGRRVRGSRGSLCTLLRCQGRYSFTCDTRYEGSSMSRVVGDWAQQSAVVPCDAATLGPSIRVSRAGALACDSRAAERPRSRANEGASARAFQVSQGRWRLDAPGMGRTLQPSNPCQQHAIKTSERQRLPYCVAVRVGPVRTPLAHVASLAWRWPTLPIARTSGRDANGGVVRNGDIYANRYFLQFLSTFGRSEQSIGTRDFLSVRNKSAVRH